MIWSLPWPAVLAWPAVLPWPALLLAALLAVAVLTVFAVRVYDVQRGPALRRWQVFVPTELTARRLNRSDWPRYIAAEDRLLGQIIAKVSAPMVAGGCHADDRFCPHSPSYAPGFAWNWNRSKIYYPEREPIGVAVLLHGLTDSPYSLRHIAELYRQRGWLALAIRLPGHGSVPAGLTRVSTDQWRAATALAVRSARAMAPKNLPLHLVGYSNGAALATDYAVRAQSDAALYRPDRLILLSAEIGVSGAARFVGLAGLPAIFPAFAKAAWLDSLPEYNPFKYNSFPVNAARQAYRMTQIVQHGLASLKGDGLASLAPILSFQSLVDATVDTAAVVEDLYDKLPANGSELVLFDVNRHAVFAPMFKAGAVPDPATLFPKLPRLYARTLVSNHADSDAVDAHHTPAGATASSTTALGLMWPPSVFSLSHIALPFPLTDALYGTQPDAQEDFGIRLGALVPRGEKKLLRVSAEVLLRMSANPFFEYIAARIAAVIDSDTK